MLLLKLKKTREIGSFKKVMNAYAEPREADVLPSDNKQKWGDDSCFGEVDGETWRYKDIQLNTSHEDVRRRKFTWPNFGGAH